VVLVHTQFQLIVDGFKSAWLVVVEVVEVLAVLVLLEALQLLALLLRMVEAVV
jgi:hypothetical protein